MFLSDRDILDAIFDGHLEIEPFNASAMLQPASIDMTLDDKLLVFSNGNAIDPKRPVFMDQLFPIGKTDPYFFLRPGEFALASTREKVTLSPNIVGRLEGKSSLGRLGLTSHVTAGFFDPGFSGYATLELFNASGRPFKLYPGMKICQMSFAFLKTPSDYPYGSTFTGSKYQNQPRGPKPSEYWRNFTNKDGS